MSQPQSASVTAAETTSERPRWQHQPALDGLRGLALLAVLLYHGGVEWLPGGLLGLDVFFGLSGFLITGLLLSERRSKGRIDLRRFYVRRARRLLPALVLLLLLVSVQVAFTAGANVRERYPKDALSVLTYIANWRFAFTHQPYFGATDPSPLLHLWSLGVEEQFYLIWPLIVTVVLARYGRRAFGRIAVLLAFASAAWMTLLAIGFGPKASTDRLYYGTDTRAAALLIGAALAVWFSGRSVAQQTTERSRRWPLVAVGYAGLAVLAVLFATTSGQAPWLYRGGFALVALCAAAIVASVCVHPQGLLSRALSIAPLTALGRISYGVYLFHWPLFLLLTHRRTGLSGPGLLLVRLTATAAAAIVSYLLVERPIRSGRIRLPRMRLTLPVTAAATVTAVLLGASLPASAAHSDTDLTSAASILHKETARTLANLSKNPTAAKSNPTAGPLRVFIAGDSIAFSAAWALTSERQHYQVDLVSDAIIGCGIVPSPYADPNSTSPIPLSACGGWKAQWKEAVQRFRPQVSAVFLGRWETVDRTQNGRTVHIGEPDYDRQLSGLLDEAIDVLSAQSGKVALIALPCLTLPELPDGKVSPADQPQRTARFNELLREAVQRHPGVASIVDINSQICPGGNVISSYRGIPLREADGIHFDPYSGPALGPLLLEPFRRLAGAAPSHVRERPNN